jgi:electron transfer flavoprotein alpha subunit
MSSRAGRVARAEARARAAQQLAQRSEESPKPAEPDYNTPSSFYGASPELSGSITGWLNSNKGNKAVGAAGADLFYNSATAALKEGSDVSYAKAMAPQALDYQRQSQGIASEARDREIASQGKVDYDRTKLTTDTTRDTAREGYQSQERQIGLTGDEARKTLLAGRADARGAMRERGRTLFA